MKKKVLQNYENKELKDMLFRLERGKPGSVGMIKTNKEAER